MASQRRHEGAGFLARGNRGHEQGREDRGLFLHRLRQRPALDQSLHDGVERCAPPGLALLGGQRAHRVDHAQAGVEQRRQFLGEKR